MIQLLHNVSMRYKTEHLIYLATKGKLKEEIEQSVWYPCAECMLQIHFIPFQYLIWVLCTPPHNYPCKMILDHGNSCVRHIALFWRKSCIEIMTKALRQFFDYDCTVCNFFTIQLNEW